MTGEQEQGGGVCLAITRPYSSGRNFIYMMVCLYPTAAEVLEVSVFV
jgi:hypothetical protein